MAAFANESTILSNAVGKTAFHTTNLCQHLIDAAVRNLGFVVNHFCIDKPAESLSFVVDGDECEFHKT